MPGGGGGGPRTQARGRRRRQATSLPLDLIAEIAARSDAATLVRCAATCRDVRGRAAEDPASGGRLRLRRTDRFVLPLLRGHLIAKYNHTGGAREKELYLVDTTAPDATRLRRAAGAVPPGPDGKPLSVKAVASRDGLLLHLREATTYRRVLRVRDAATGRSHTLPPDPAFPERHYYGSHERYVLLVGDGKDDGGAGGAGRPFQVVKARLVPSHHRHGRYMELQTFSSEHGEWGPYTKIPTPQLEPSCGSLSDAGRPLVAGGAVHWLCGDCLVKLNVRAARVTATTLPAGFPVATARWRQRQSQLLAVAPDGSPMVLVADGERITAWEQSKHTAIWKQRPRVVIENAAILQFNGVAGLIGRAPNWTYDSPQLVWFAERSGAVLIQMGQYYGNFWLDLQSMKIVRWFLDPSISYATVHCPLEMELSSWVPTFSRTLL
ncbi:hypothetical protein ACP4OV_007119 [Aristida adscensionis]